MLAVKRLVSLGDAFIDRLKESEAAMARSVISFDVTPAMDKAGAAALERHILRGHPDDGGGTYIDPDTHKAVFKAMVDVAGWR